MLIWYLILLYCFFSHGFLYNPHWIVVKIFWLVLVPGLSLFLPNWFLLTFIQFSCLDVFNSLGTHGLQHARLPCPSSSPRACSNSCPLSQWCHPTISSSVVPFSSCLQSFPATATGSFQMSQFFASGGQSIRISGSASVFPMNIQYWFPLGLTDVISL